MYSERPRRHGRSVLLYVYRLRQRGIRQGRLGIANDGARGDLRFEPLEVGWRGRSMMLASLLVPGTQTDIIPRLEEARILRVRQAIVLAGIEAVSKGRKGVERFRQTWVCTIEPVPLEMWPERRGGALGQAGFDPADDDYA